MADWTLNVRGLNLLIRELGQGDDGVPNICLHGWLDHGMAFAEVTRGLPGRWLAPDQRGFGQSDHIGQGGYYHFADLLPDLDALVNHLGRPVNLLGHSMGGTVASIYAAARPNRVERLVVAEGLGAIEWEEPNQLDRIRKHLDQIKRPPGPVRIDSVSDAAERLRQRHPGLDPEVAQLLAAHGTTADQRGLRWSFDPLHMVQGPYPFRQEAYLEMLAEIVAPTLVVWGSKSWYPDDVRTLRAQTIPDVRVATLNGGHMLPYDAPRELGQLVAEHFGLL